MPINPNSLIDIIGKNKSKRVAAKKIIESNPKAIPVISKLTSRSEVASNIEKDNFEINRSILEDIHLRIKSLKENNKNIIKLFPDIELAIQVIVSSILSPKKMTDIQLNYKLSKDFKNDPSILADVLEVIKNHANDHYELEDKLPDILRESLFDSGAYVQVIIPEASVDEVINSDLVTTYSTEDFNNRAQQLVRNLVSPINMTSIIKDAVERPTVSLEGVCNNLVSNSLIHVTDNTNILRFSCIRDDINSKLIRNSMRGGVGVSMETRDKIQYLDIFRNKQTTPSGKTIEFIKQKDATARKSMGRPMIMKIPTESIIPVFVPGDRAEHIGYFVLLDESGRPLNLEAGDNSLKQVNTMMSMNPGASLTPTQKAYNNLISDQNANLDVNSLFDMYKDVLEKEIYGSIKSSLYGTDVEIANKNDIYFLMFMRALADQRTSLLYVPRELVVYYAFQYTDIGTGKSLLEDLSVLSSLRAILLFSKIMAHAKQSIDVTKVNVSLDPNDPDPEKTIEQVQDSVLKLRQNFLPLGINNPVDLVNWIQRAGLQFSYDNNPRLPNLKLDFENANLSHTVPSSELEDDLRKQTIIALGLSPETIDSGFTPDFATTVVNNNILLSKRISIYQNKLSKHLHKFINIVTFNDEELRGEIKEMLVNNLARLGEGLEEEEKQLLAKDREAFLEYYIDVISENLEISLPKPDNTNIANLSMEFEVYREGLDKVVESIISPEIFTSDVTGEISDSIDSVRSIYKNYLLRKWMSDNNFFPEALDITSELEEEVEPILNIITGHLSSTMRNSTKLLSLMSKYKLATNIDLARIAKDGEGSTSDEDSYDSDVDTDSDSDSENEDDDDIDLDW